MRDRGECERRVEAAISVIKNGIRRDSGENSRCAHNVKFMKTGRLEQSPSTNKENIKSSSRTCDVYDNTGPSNKVSCEKMSFPQGFRDHAMEMWRAKGDALYPGS